MAYYQSRILATGTSFNPEDNGVWTLADCNGDGTLDLCYIKTRNTGSGTIEVHWTTSESRFQEPYRSTGTCYQVQDGGNGTFLMQDFTGDGKADLVFIKTRNTGTNSIEVHVASADSNYQNFVWHSGSCFGVEDNGLWFMSDKKDLVYVKTRNTGTNKIEYHVSSAASEYKQFTVHEGSDFAIEDNGTWTIAPTSSGAYPDLYYIKTRETGTHMVEVHASSAGSAWKQRILSTGTGFGMEDNGHWLMANWSHQERPDLVYIKTRNTGTNRVEVHVNEYKSVTPQPYVAASRNVALEGATLKAELQRNDGSWREASIELDMVLGNIEGKFQWGQKQFSSSARNIRLNNTLVEAELRLSNGTWSTDSCDLSQRLMNNDGAFQATEVPVIIAIPKEQEKVFLNQLDKVMNGPDFKIEAREEPDGATTFYFNAGVGAEGTIFRAYTAEAKASIMHLSQKNGHPITQVNIDTFVADANATTTMVGTMPIYAGVDAGVSIFKGSASLFDLNLGVGVDTGAGIKDGSLDLHLAGCGFQVGRKVSISVFGASFGVDLGRLFG